MQISKLIQTLIEIKLNYGEVEIVLMRVNEHPQRDKSKIIVEPVTDVEANTIEKLCEVEHPVYVDKNDNPLKVKLQVINEYRVERDRIVVFIK